MNTNFLGLTPLRRSEPVAPLSRGDRREDIYQDEVDRQEFIKTLAEAAKR